jgi:hypothetical protein
MSVNVTSLSFNAATLGTIINSGSNTFAMGGTFPMNGSTTKIASSNVSFNFSTGSYDSLAIDATNSTATTLKGSFNFSPPQGSGKRELADVTTTVTDPDGGPSSTYPSGSVPMYVSMPTAQTPQ